jgi:hypothetical protein
MITDQNSVFDGRKKSGENVGLEHLPGLLAEHNFAMHFPEQVYVSGKTSRCDPNDISLLEAAQVYISTQTIALLYRVSINFVEFYNSGDYAISDTF